MFGNRIKLDDELFQKVKQCAEAAGYSSTDEFVAHVLEKETTRILGTDELTPEDEEKIKRRLEGLGYIE